MAADILSVGFQRWATEETEALDLICDNSIQDFAAAVQENIEWLNEYSAAIHRPTQSGVSDLLKTPSTRRKKQLATVRNLSSLDLFKRFESDEDVFANKQTNAGPAHPTTKLQQQLFDSLSEPSEPVEVTIAAGTDISVAVADATIEANIDNTNNENPANSSSFVMDMSMVSSDTDSSFVAEVSIDGEDGVQPKKVRKTKKQAGRKKGGQKRVAAVKVKNVASLPVSRLSVEEMGIDKLEEVDAMESAMLSEKTETGSFTFDGEMEISQPVSTSTAPDPALTLVSTPVSDLEFAPVLATQQQPTEQYSSIPATLSTLMTPLSRNNDPQSSRPAQQKTKSLIAGSRTLSTSFSLARSTSFSLAAPDTISGPSTARFRGLVIAEEEEDLTSELLFSSTLIRKRSGELGGPAHITSDSEAKKRRSSSDAELSKLDVTTSSSSSSSNILSDSHLSQSSTMVPSYVSDNSSHFNIITTKNDNDPVVTSEKRLKDMFTTGTEKLKKALSSLRAIPIPISASTSSVLAHATLPPPALVVAASVLVPSNVSASEQPVESPRALSHVALEDDRSSVPVPRAATVDVTTDVFSLLRPSLSSSLVLNSVKPAGELPSQQPAGRISEICEDELNQSSKGTRISGAADSEKVPQATVDVHKTVDDERHVREVTQEHIEVGADEEEREPRRLSVAEIIESIERKSRDNSTELARSNRNSSGTASRRTSSRSSLSSVTSLEDADVADGKGRNKELTASKSSTSTMTKPIGLFNNNEANTFVRAGVVTSSSVAKRPSDPVVYTISTTSNPFLVGSDNAQHDHPKFLGVEDVEPDIEALSAVSEDTSTRYRPSSARDRKPQRVSQDGRPPESKRISSGSIKSAGIDREKAMAKAMTTTVGSKGMVSHELSFSAGHEIARNSRPITTTSSTNTTTLVLASSLAPVPAKSVPLVRPKPELKSLQMAAVAARREQQERERKAAARQEKIERSRQRKHEEEQKRAEELRKKEEERSRKAAVAAEAKLKEQEAARKPKLFTDKQKIAHSKQKRPNEIPTSTSSFAPNKEGGGIKRARPEEDAIAEVKISKPHFLGTTSTVLSALSVASSFVPSDREKAEVKRQKLDVGAGGPKKVATKESTANILPPKLPASEHISIAATADSTVTLSSLAGDAKISPPPPYAPKQIFAQSNHGIPLSASSASSALTYENATASSFKTPASSSRPGAASENHGNVNSEQSYELPEIDSENFADILNSSSHSYSEEEESQSESKMAEWAQSPALRSALLKQSSMNPENIFGQIQPLRMEGQKCDMLDLDIFKVKPRKFRSRSSSANWSGADKLTQQEEMDYHATMGYKN
ncbi:hypothetical protein BC937DRAFT_88719 [Endogone sp. FLAS-F59071]|nr:hypothetical protein BC937DRAFT_88719 [Endogone sp. FLAS-F59071]|eukprot:RUS22506.1 hypothetical protein BC937DRAFT_88719 [Endogone sp. FLAS-F59071]